MRMFDQARFFATAIVCGAVVLASGAAFGAAPRMLTLDEALSIALENNRDILKAQEYRNKVMGIYVEQRASALPQLTMTGNANRSWDQALAERQSTTIETAEIAVGPFTLPRTRISITVPPDATDKTVSAILTQPLYTWGQIGAAVKAAKFGIASADDQLRTFRQAALRDVSAAFYDVLLAKELHSIALQNLQQKEAHLDQASRRFSAGVATEYDVLAAEVVVENARPDVIRLENLVRTARERLRFILGIGDEVDATGTFEISGAAVPSYEDTIERALKKRPELADLRNRVGFTAELIKVAKAGDKPRLDFKATGGYRVLTANHEDFEGKTWTVGLALSFPFFDGFRTKGRVAQAKSDLSTVRIEEAKTIDAISLQVRDAINAVNESDGVIRALSGTVALAERLLQMAEKGYEYGVKTRLDVDDAALNLRSARGSLASAKRNNLVARVNLAYAIGILGEEGNSHP
jgi:outer membrane protein TolC